MIKLSDVSLEFHGLIRLTSHDLPPKASASDPAHHVWILGASKILDRVPESN